MKINIVDAPKPAEVLRLVKTIVDLPLGKAVEVKTKDLNDINIDLLLKEVKKTGFKLVLKPSVKRGHTLLYTVRNNTTLSKDVSVKRKRKSSKSSGTKVLAKSLRERMARLKVGDTLYVDRIFGGGTKGRKTFINAFTGARKILGPNFVYEYPGRGRIKISKMPEFPNQQIGEGFEETASRWALYSKVGERLSLDIRFFGPDQGRGGRIRRLVSRIKKHKSTLVNALVDKGRELVVLERISSKVCEPKPGDYIEGHDRKPLLIK